MRFKIKCNVCGDSVWVRGEHEEDVNATVLDDTDPAWVEACEHIKATMDYDIVDSEAEEFEDNVI